MSQAKVDRYKEQKANRQKIMQKEKRERLLWKIGGCACVVVLAGWIGVSAFSSFYTAPKKSYEVKTTAIDDYISSIEADETE
ncbi:MAG: hypothetical protein Q4B01_09505 [Eubacteriales bacterium]|nr:hypothetical protein [Eubacteriales bacterium]